MYDLTTCATLLSCFDFSHRGLVDQDDWKRGTKMLLLGDMGEDEGLWLRLLKKYGGDVAGHIDVRILADFVPMDPRMNLMMKAMVASVAGVTDKLERTTKRAADQSASRANRIILNMRRTILEPVLVAWHGLVKQRVQLANKAFQSLVNIGLGKGLRAWMAYWEERVTMRHHLSRFARRLANRELGRGWNQWIDQYDLIVKLRTVGRRLRCVKRARRLRPPRVMRLPWSCVCMDACTSLRAHTSPAEIHRRAAEGCDRGCPWP